MDTHLSREMQYDFIKGVALTYMGGVFMQHDIIIPPLQGAHPFSEFVDIVEHIHAEGHTRYGIACAMLLRACDHYLSVQYYHLLV